MTTGRWKDVSPNRFRFSVVEPSGAYWSREEDRQENITSDVDQGIVPDTAQDQKSTLVNLEETCCAKFCKFSDQAEAWLSRQRA
jgi:hypothetical protein